MRWDRGYSNPEVEDRRGEGFSGGGFGGGGLPLFGIIRLFGIFGWKGILVGLIIAAFVGFVIVRSPDAQLATVSPPAR